MKEIVTLQFGPNANQVASKYWQQQSPQTSKDSVFSREVLLRGSDKTEPRTLIFDCHGGFDIAVNDLSNGDASFDTTMWADTPKFVLPTEIPESKKRWSDSDSTVYHKNSSLMLPIHQLPNSFLAGQQIADTFEHETDSIDNNLRFFIEECDSLQGFQAFTEFQTGFAGFSINYLEKIRDQYPKVPIFQWVAPHQDTSPVNKINFSLSALKSSEIDAHLIPWDSKYFDNQLSIFPEISSEELDSSTLSLASDCVLSPARAIYSLAAMSNILTSTGLTYINELKLQTFPNIIQVSPKNETSIFGEIVTTWANTPIRKQSTSEASRFRFFYNVSTSVFSNCDSIDASLRSTTKPFEELRKLAKSSHTWAQYMQLTDDPSSHAELTSGIKDDLLDLAEVYSNELS